MSTSHALPQSPRQVLCSSLPWIIRLLNDLWAVSLAKFVVLLTFLFAHKHKHPGTLFAPSFTNDKSYSTFLFLFFPTLPALKKVMARREYKSFERAVEEGAESKRK